MVATSRSMAGILGCGFMHFLRTKNGYGWLVMIGAYSFITWWSLATEAKNQIFGNFGNFEFTNHQNSSIHPGISDDDLHRSFDFLQFDLFDRGPFLKDSYRTKTTSICEGFDPSIHMTVSKKNNWSFGFLVHILRTHQIKSPMTLSHFKLQKRVDVLQKPSELLGEHVWQTMSRGLNHFPNLEEKDMSGIFTQQSSCQQYLPTLISI